MMSRTIGIAALACACLNAQGQTEDSNAALLQTIQKLEKRIEVLERRLAVSSDQSPVTATPAEVSSTTAPAPAGAAPLQPAAQPAPVPAGVPGDLPGGIAFGATLDGYYGYNFNRPLGRVNLLRAYDVLSNSFSLSQATLILERDPDPTAGSRFGARVDLQYGQATETVQGNALQEPRPQVYRPLWQAYGTYVFPIGSGLTVDFGKWAGSLGFEGNYNKDQINYTRAYLFGYLPFYHFGFRTSYNLNDHLSVTWWLVNGVGQSEDFNGWKSNAVLLAIKPTKNVTWNVNYYEGQEGRDTEPDLNPGIPILATQPGLGVVPIPNPPNGRMHIFDSYVSAKLTPKLLFGLEGDYVVSRAYSNSSPGHVSAGAAYARYQLFPRFALAGRSEYLSDRGGLFSGLTQALKETTATAEYRFTEGFLARAEWRRDFSNRPYFLTNTPGVLKDDQNTATLGMIWWFGDKPGSW